MTENQTRRYDQAVLITRNNSWLVPRTCEIADALALNGIKIALIAYTGSSPAWVRADKTPQLSQARSWIDDYYERFISWLEERVGNKYEAIGDYQQYLNSRSYLTLNQLAHKYGLPSAIKIEKMGDLGREQYHKLVTALPNLERTIGISVDTRLLIAGKTLDIVPHDGFHAGRMKAIPGKVKALGDFATIKMVNGHELSLQASAHRLAGHDQGIDAGGVIGQVTFDVDPDSETMYITRDTAYKRLVGGYIKDVLPRRLYPGNEIIIQPQGNGLQYPEVDEQTLRGFLPGWKKDEKVPHKRLVTTRQFLEALLLIMPEGISICDIPDPMSVGITKYELMDFERSRNPTGRFGEVAATYDEYQGQGLS